MSRVMYFVVDPTHTDFPYMLLAAQASNEQYVAMTSKVSWHYNIDSTKAQAKVIGGTDDWYETSTWYNHPAIISVFDESQHAEFAALLTDPEWFIPDTDV